MENVMFAAEEQKYTPAMPHGAINPDIVYVCMASFFRIK